MAEPVPNVSTAMKSFNVASNAQTEHGYPLGDPAHNLPPSDGEKSGAFPDSSRASTQLNSGSDGAADQDPDGAVADEKASPGGRPEQVRRITGIRWILVVISILSSTFLYALDNTVVADVQPKIVDRFGEIQKLPWLAIGFLVACVATNLIW